MVPREHNARAFFRVKFQTILVCTAGKFFDPKLSLSSEVDILHDILQRLIYCTKQIWTLSEIIEEEAVAGNAVLNEPSLHTKRMELYTPPSGTPFFCT